MHGPNILVVSSGSETGRRGEGCWQSRMEQSVLAGLNNNTQKLNVAKI